MSLHWLSAPPDASTDLRPSASKGRPAKNDLVKKSDPYAAAETRAEKRPDDHAETEIAASRLGSEASGKAVPEAPPNETGVNEDNTKAQTKKAEDVPTDGCVPLGLTAQGELVFPIQCQALPERHRGAAVSQPPVQTHPTRSAPAPKQAQAAEPARLDGNKNADLNRRQSPGNAATAKVVNVSPSSEAKPEEAKPEEAKSEEAKSGEAKPDEAKSDEAKPGKENSPPVAANGKNVGKRMMQSAHSKPVMMILRTVEFPDGHREQHLLPMSHLRSTAFRTEEEWFDPLTFR